MSNFEMRTEHWLHYQADKNGKLLGSAYATSATDGPYGPTGINRDSGTQVYSVRLVTESAIAQAAAEPIMFGIVGPDNKPYLGEQCVAGSAEALADELKALNEDIPDYGGYRAVPVYLGAPSDAYVTLERIYAALGIGVLARTPGTILTNINNLKRFSDCLAAVEREFFMVPGEPSDEPDDEGCEPESECLLNSWGAASVEDYVEQFRAALGKIDPVHIPPPCTEAPADIPQDQAATWVSAYNACRINALYGRPPEIVAAAHGLLKAAAYHEANAQGWRVRAEEARQAIEAAKGIYGTDQPGQRELNSFNDASNRAVTHQDFASDMRQMATGADPRHCPKTLSELSAPHDW